MTNNDAINDNRKKILVVDDNAINLRLIQEILKKQYKVYASPTGERALKFLESQIPDLILLDIEMPGMDGYEVIKKLKDMKEWSTIPVIFLTATEGKEAEEKAFSMGAVDYIQKPITSGIVLARVGLHTELQSYRQDLEHMVEQKTNELTLTQDAILDLLANITAFRDNETGGHILRTTKYTKLIVDKLRTVNHPAYYIDEKKANDIIKCAKLHDVGKVAIPDAILLKPSGLTPSEFEFIKMHTTFGAQMIDKSKEELGNISSFLDVAREIVIGHHEWWDGSGYPYGLKGGETPISARIMTISDVYDALISERTYKKAFSHEEAIEILHKESGEHFDPYLMEIIEDVFVEFKIVADEHTDEKYTMYTF